MTEQVAVRKERHPLSPRDWFVLGLIAVFVGAIVGVGIGGDSDGAAAALICTIPGSLMVTIGVIAKAVQVGIRSTQD